MNILRTIVFAMALLCAGVAGVAGLIYVLQDSMMFYNTKDEASRAILQGMPGYHEVAFTATNGKTYHGMMYLVADDAEQGLADGVVDEVANGENGERADGAGDVAGGAVDEAASFAPLVIYFGGNAEVSHRHMRTRDAQSQWGYFPGFHYLYIDYEGYGLNGGRPHYLNMYEQALAVFDYAASLPNVDSTRIVAMGYSLGTGSAVHLAANRPVAGLILATPYANGYDLYNNVLPIFNGPMRYLVRQKLPSDTFASDVACPVLVIASRRDEVIPFASSERLAGLFPGDVRFVTLDHALHNHIFQAEGVFDEVQAFLVAVAGVGE